CRLSRATLFPYTTLFRSQQLQGVLSKEFLVDENPDSLLSSLRSMQPILAYVLEDQHILDALQSITAYGFDVLPVLSHDRHFQGYVDQRTLVRKINQMLGTKKLVTSTVFKWDFWIFLFHNLPT